MLKWLEGKKTYIAGGLSVVVGVAALAGVTIVPDVTAANAPQFIETALLAMFVRHGVSTQA